MKKVILLSLLTLGAVILAPVVASAAWTAPKVAPTGCVSGDPGCDAPINVGPVMQEKAAGLSLSVFSGYNALGVKNKTTNQQVFGVNPYGTAGQGYFSIWGSKDGATWLSLITGKDGKVGIGGGNTPKIPVEALDVAGAVKIGTTASANAGTIRWTGQDFEGYVGVGTTKGWRSLTETGTTTLPVCTEGKILKYAGGQWSCGEDIGATGSIVFGYDSDYRISRWGAGTFSPSGLLTDQLSRRVVTLNVPSWAGAAVLSYKNTNPGDYRLNFYGYAADGKLKPIFFDWSTRGRGGLVTVPLNSRGEFVIETNAIEGSSFVEIMVTGLIAGQRPVVPVERITLTGVYYSATSQCKINYRTYNNGSNGNLTHDYLFSCGTGNQADTLAKEEGKISGNDNVFKLIYLENMVRFIGFPGKTKDACKSLPAVISGTSASITFECI